MYYLGYNNLDSVMIIASRFQSMNFQRSAGSMSQQGLAEKPGRGLADSAGPSLRLSWAWVKWAFDSRAQSERASYAFGQ